MVRNGERMSGCMNEIVSSAVFLDEFPDNQEATLAPALSVSQPSQSVVRHATPQELHRFVSMTDSSQLSPQVMSRHCSSQHSPQVTSRRGLSQPSSQPSSHFISRQGTPQESIRLVSSYRTEQDSQHLSTRNGDPLLRSSNVIAPLEASSQEILVHHRNILVVGLNVTIFFISEYMAKLSLRTLKNSNDQKFSLVVT